MHAVVWDGKDFLFKSAVYDHHKHSVWRPPDGDICGSKNISGPFEVLQTCDHSPCNMWKSLFSV